MIFCAEGAVPSFTGLGVDGGSFTGAGFSGSLTGFGSGLSTGRISSGPAPIGRVVSVFISGRPVGTGVALAAAALVLIEPRTAPTPTVSPSFAVIASITPA